jgi:hypothetical protein
MNKKQLLDVLTTLSALESWAYAQGKSLPCYLTDDIANAVGVLKDAIFDETT